MSKQKAPVCRIIQRPHGTARQWLQGDAYVTYMQRPGTDYTDVMVGDRRECLRAAIQVAADRADYEARQNQQ